MNSNAWLLVGAYLIWSAAAGADEETLRKIAWEGRKADDTKVSGEVTGRDPKIGAALLKVTNETDQAKTFTILVLDAPGVTGAGYSVSGKVRYQGVEGRGYLEMWSHFPGGKAYFSRTLDSEGPMSSLTGDSDWRDFLVPFSIGATSDRPIRLVLNVVLPGKGSVWLSPMVLTQTGATTAHSIAPGTWWSERDAGWLGGILGGVSGLLGALIGILASLRRARSLVMGLLKGAVVLGVLLLVAGVVALVCKQPYCVYFPLLLPGVILMAVCGGNIPAVRKRYEELELRRMLAQDA